MKNNFKLLVKELRSSKLNAEVALEHLSDKTALSLCTRMIEILKNKEKGVPYANFFYFGKNENISMYHIDAFATKINQKLQQHNVKVKVSVDKPHAHPDKPFHFEFDTSQEINLIQQLKEVLIQQSRSRLSKDIKNPKRNILDNLFTETPNTNTSSIDVFNKAIHSIYELGSIHYWPVDKNTDHHSFFYSRIAKNEEEKVVKEVNQFLHDNGFKARLSVTKHQNFKDLMKPITGTRFILRFHFGENKSLLEQWGEVEHEKEIITPQNVSKTTKTVKTL